MICNVSARASPESAGGSVNISEKIYHTAAHILASGRASTYANPLYPDNQPAQHIYFILLAAILNYGLCLLWVYGLMSIVGSTNANFRR
jgi:hypothetical protein